ncbi:MAG: Bcr/CflA family multidrug efflux MFS transporter [Proteobacteria bacterium]|nr:MAG: Bcr/CflA family multidrug efflux MFS transporter [Pseudomonadota bacterium]
MEQKPAKFALLVGILGTLTAFGPLSIDMYLPAFPEIAKEFVAPIASIQLSLTSFFIGLATGQVLYGPLIDRFGRKPPVYLGLVIYVLASIACAFAPNTELLITARFAQALGACGGMVASRTIVRDLFNETESARVFSLLMLVMGVAPILAPLLGGYVTMAFGWRALFAILAILSLLCLLGVYLLLPETRGPNPENKLSSALKNYVEIAKSRRFMGFAIAGGLAQAGMFAYITGSPFVFIEIFKIPAEHYGWIFGSNAFGLIAASQINMRLLKKYHPEKIIRVSFVVLALSGLALLTSAYLNLGFIVLLLPLFLFVGTLGLTLPNTTAAALSAEGPRAGSASAFLGTLQFTFAAVSSMLVSTFDNGTAIPMAGTIAGCGFLALLVFTLATRRVAVLSPSK